jgi:hypothetical protein
LTDAKIWVRRYVGCSLRKTPTYNKQLRRLKIALRTKKTGLVSLWLQKRALYSARDWDVECGNNGKQANKELIKGIPFYPGFYVATNEQQHRHFVLGRRSQTHGIEPHSRYRRKCCVATTLLTPVYLSAYLRCDRYDGFAKLSGQRIITSHNPGGWSNFKEADCIGSKPAVEAIFPC